MLWASLYSFPSALPRPSQPCLAWSLPPLPWTCPCRFPSPWPSLTALPLRSLPSLPWPCPCRHTLWAAHARAADEGHRGCGYLLRPRHRRPSDHGRGAPHVAGAAPALPYRWVHPCSPVGTPTLIDGHTRSARSGCCSCMRKRGYERCCTLRRGLGHSFRVLQQWLHEELQVLGVLTNLLVQFVPYYHCLIQCVTRH